MNDHAIYAIRVEPHDPQGEGYWVAVLSTEEVAHREAERLLVLFDARSTITLVEVWSVTSLLNA